MPTKYMELPATFPTYALVDALGVIRAGGITPEGAKVLLRSGFEVEGWALGAYLGNTRLLVGDDFTATLTDEQAQNLISELVEPEVTDTTKASDDTPINVSAPLPQCSPATALKIAKWLIEAAKIVLPILL